MEIINNDTTGYQHLERWKMKFAEKAQKIKEDRQIENDFGKVTLDEDEYIWNLENLNRK